MSEQIMINDEAVVVPPKVVSAGRAAVQSFHREQLAAKKIPHIVLGNGDPIVIAGSFDLGTDEKPRVVDLATADETDLTLFGRMQNARRNISGTRVTIVTAFPADAPDPEAVAPSTDHSE